MFTWSTLTKAYSNIRIFLKSNHHITKIQHHSNFTDLIFISDLYKILAIGSAVLLFDLHGFELKYQYFIKDLT
ncbi:hypothetical protein TSAR_012659 [Trichomalopsis sarcophagae]|uniref:Uncharacterized protein n=1 Tax=Trichomalopsis sarcophagae TaxID=543379 RepID=A0A232FJK2_9HYME|nr:hypothetical protein TSAR_012659 [Trichomalopsis sarcophagae]